MKRRARTLLQRTKIFTTYGGKCHLCGHKIDAVKEGYELEHVVPFAMTNDDSDENLRPAHKACHKDKTKDDVAAIAKAKRIEAKHLGRPKSNWQSRGFNQPYVDRTKYIERDFDT
jgi:5-methylcytosine-specific restriction enzyme A